MATQFGTTNGVFGLTAQTGVLQDSAQWDYTDSQKFVIDGDGDFTGSTHYGEGIEGTTITLSDTPTDYLKGTVGSSFVVKSVGVRKAADDYNRITIGWYCRF